MLAQLASGPPLVLNVPNLTVGPGQTLDLGAFGPAACTDGTTVLLPQATQTDDTPADPEPAGDASN